jgi:hypothetical protein
MPYICGKCKRDFKARCRLERHMAKKIPCDAPRPHVCECGKTFLNLSALFKHKKGCDGQQPERRRQLTLKDAQDAARKREGECLSTDYEGVNSVMLWQCKFKHEAWPMSLNSVRNRGHWCPTCAGNLRLDLSIAQQAALKRGGRCLSTDYRGSRHDLEWACRLGHKWEASLNEVKDAGRWCPTCAGNQRLDISVARQVALEKGGKCLSDTYVNSISRLEWICKFGHIWSATLNSVKDRKTWCPRCRESKGETETRAIFEELLSASFPKTRPSFLGGLELDGYNEDLSLAFEYNGFQHYEFVPYFHPNGLPDLIAQKERDERKKQLCDDDGITLITVPYNETDKFSYIAHELFVLGYIDA